MKTAAEIITLLKMELAEAHELYQQTIGREAMFYFHKIEILTHLLEEIEE